ncbi:MAG: AI-2E family transporter [Bacilli bacterium]|nr:AI-2E family transporter [Bacilli bacterium]
MKYNKLKELVLFLISIILVIFIVKYLNIISILGTFFKLMIPVFIGFIYAWLVNPLINKLSVTHKRNFICVSLFLFIILVLITFLYLLVPTVYKEVHELVDMLPDLVGLLQSKFSVIGFNFEKMSSILLSEVPLYIVELVKRIFSFLGILGVGLIIGLYISFDYDKVIESILSLIPRKIKCIFITISQEVSVNVRKCVNGTLLIAFFVFLLDTIGFMILGLDASLLLGMVCGITDLIPYIGPYIGGALAVLVGFTESKKLGFMTLGVCFVVQSIENYILQPFIMSKSIKISPIFIIIGMIIFGELFGIAGMILATPFVAMIKVFLEHIQSALKKCK